VTGDVEPYLAAFATLGTLPSRDPRGVGLSRPPAGRRCGRPWPRARR
jgi:hypothetical protein